MTRPSAWKRAVLRRRPRISKTWLVPALYAAGAVTAGMVFPRLESRFLPEVTSGVSVSAAMAFYSSIASGMIALTGIVFSLAFVMVQFSATAYSPRLVLWVARDPFLSHALGVFSATFLYAIAALVWVDRGGAARVPLISSIVVLVLLVASVGMFVGLIQRIGLLQIHRMLAFTGGQGRRVIDALYPPLESADVSSAPGELGSMAASQTLTHRGSPLAIQAVDIDALVNLARRAGGLIELLAVVGDTVQESTSLLRVVGARKPIDDRRLIEAIHMGEERTFDQDPKYAIRLLVDIAIRALSPAINDPTTAVQALDQIGDLLFRLGRRRLEAGAFRDGDGHVRLVMPLPTWEDFLMLAFDEIRSYGADSVQVMRRMGALISDLISAVPDERRPALVQWQRRLHTTIERHFADPEDRADALAEDRQGLGVPRRRPAEH